LVIFLFGCENFECMRQLYFQTRLRASPLEIYVARLRRRKIIFPPFPSERIIFLLWSRVILSFSCHSEKKKDILLNVLVFFLGPKKPRKRNKRHWAVLWQRGRPAVVQLPSAFSGAIKRSSFFKLEPPDCFLKFSI